MNDRIANEGYSGQRAAEIVGITYRQLDYWARTDLVRPSLADAKGSGSRRRYSYRDLLELKTIKRLLDAGIKLELVRDVFTYMRENLGEDITRANLVIQGNKSVLIQTDGELLDLVKQGQGVLNILPLAVVVQEVDAKIVELRPAVETDTMIKVVGAGVVSIGASSQRRSPSASSAPDFAHNSERQFAKLLDFYGIDWLYEPHTFVLERNAAGDPVHAFSPDFFLPAYDLYIEITTLRQKLVTKKNRKARRLVELYPGTQIKILYQRDYLNLLVKYGLESPDQLSGYGDVVPAADSSVSLLGLGTFEHPRGSRGAA